MKKDKIYKIALLYAHSTELYATDRVLQEIRTDRLRDDVSTDEIYPAKFCIYYKNIGKYSLTGDRHEVVHEDYIRTNNVKCIVAGNNFGSGSAREHAAITLKESGVEIILAKSFNHTFRENAINLGLLVSTNLNLLAKITPQSNMRQITLAVINSEYTTKERKIHNSGGLLKTKTVFGKAESIKQSLKPKNTVEKIISSHTLKKTKANSTLRTDIRFTYEVFGPLISEIIRTEGYTPKEIKDPSTILFFEDHFIQNPHPQVKKLVVQQRDFAKMFGAKVYKHTSGDTGICHTILTEKHILPGSVVIGTDSHTTTGGALNALCIPVGATRMAQSFLHNSFDLKTPNVINIILDGDCKKSVTSKDVVLQLMKYKALHKQNLSNTILEFSGSYFDNTPIDEHIVLTNMSKEIGALSAVIQPNKQMISFLHKERGLSADEINLVYPDSGAKYTQTFSINVSNIDRMVAQPPSPKNTTSVESLAKNNVKLDKIFVGSCTGGKYHDIKLLSETIGGADISDGVRLYIQPASSQVLAKVKKEGIYQTLSKKGAIFLPTSCGACIGQGEASVKEDEIILSTSNRNYKGRMGKGQSYLSSPITAGLSAVAGKIC